MKKIEEFQKELAERIGAGMAAKTNKPMIPEMLTSSELADGASYEVWLTPQRKPLYRVYYIENDMIVNEHGFETEVQARTFFEKAVENKYVPPQEK